MENKILPSSSGGYDTDSCGTRLGKRISRPVDLPEFSWPPESRLKENGPLLFTTEENTRESTVNQSKSAKMVALGDRFQHDQSNYQSNIEGFEFTSNRNAQENEDGGVNHYPLLCMELQSTQHQHPHWKSDVPTGETPESLNWVSKTSNMLAQADAGRSCSKSNNLYTEKFQFHPYRGDLVFGNPVVTSRMPLEMHNVSTEVVREAGAVEQVFSAHRSDEKPMLPSNKMSPAAEKLWEGSLQLNASVTVSVVAFFKSGEKLPDLKWSEFVEVKGKVRLDAFEKYIQELPRSRNRGLMVISLFSKEGASEKGLKGMKEVAKGYIKGERVGFAHLSPGVDVYLCPRSNAIITILAKYGFFKGMAAVEGNSELMIGCVVWRKNRIALTSVAKKSEEKANVLQEQFQKSPSDSSSLQGGGQGSLSVPSVKNSNPSAPLSSFSTLEQANVTDDKSVGIDSTSRTTLTASGVKSAPFQQKESELSSSLLWGSKGHLSSSEVSCVRQSNAEPPKESTDLPKPVTSLLPNASKRKMAFSDDDDLPEFDFGTASGISSSSHCSDGSILGSRLQLSGSRIFDMSKQPTRPVAPSVSMSIPRSVISVSKDMPLARNVNVHGQLVTASRQMEEKHKSQSHAIPVAVTVCASGSPMVQFDSSGKKNLFCDDDMPEWLPPDARHERTNGPPKTLPTESSDSSLRMLPPLPTRSVFPYPSSATIHNSFSSQPSPPLYHLPANSKVPPPVPSQDGPSYLTGFTFNPAPRPQSSSLASASPLQPADKRV